MGRSAFADASPFTREPRCVRCGSDASHSHPRSGRVRWVIAMRSARLRWFTSRLALCAVLWVAFVLARIVYFASVDDAVRADAIVVLGAAAYGEVPSPVLRARVDHGITLLRRGLARKLVFTGGVGPSDTLSEAEVARRYALRAGVAEDDILVETRSTMTFGNLAEAQRVMTAHGLRTAILVSDPFHLYRARTMSHALHFHVVTSPTPTSVFRTWRTKLPFLLRELVYFHLYLIKGE